MKTARNFVQQRQLIGSRRHTRSRRSVDGQARTWVRVAIVRLLRTTSSRLGRKDERDQGFRTCGRRIHSDWSGDRFFFALRRGGGSSCARSRQGEYLGARPYPTRLRAPSIRLAGARRRRKMRLIRSLDGPRDRGGPLRARNGTRTPARRDASIHECRAQLYKPPAPSRTRRTRTKPTVRPMNTLCA